MRHAQLSHVTDRLMDGQTDTANTGNNSLHLMHSMQPNNGSMCAIKPTVQFSYYKRSKSSACTVALAFTVE